MQFLDLFQELQMYLKFELMRTEYHQKLQKGILFSLAILATSFFDWLVEVSTLQINWVSRGKKSLIDKAQYSMISFQPVTTIY